MNYESIDNILALKKKFLIYGAGVIAYELFAAFEYQYHIRPEYFVVSDENNVGFIDSVEVVTIDKIPAEKRNLPIIVATPEIYHKEIIEHLKKYSMNDYYCINSHLEYCFMSEYLHEKYLLTLVSSLSGEAWEGLQGETAFSVYMAKSHKDVKLLHQYNIPQWIVPVQAGYECSGIRTENITDADGINISRKNPDYCELTVTYWAWKNRRNKYKGICHYRRRLLLSETELQQCILNDIDMILPLPYVCYPDASGQYYRYIGERDRLFLKEALEIISPEYLELWEMLDKQQLFYNYNILIAKEDIFDHYAEWVFTVLRQVEKLCKENGLNRNDRYAGYLGELLTTLYIMKNKDSLRIVHAEKEWMI